MKAKTAKNLCRQNVGDMPLDKLLIHRRKLMSAILEAKAEYGYEQAVKDGYMTPVTICGMSGFKPIDMSLGINLRYALAAANDRQYELLTDATRDKTAERVKPITETGNDKFKGKERDTMDEQNGAQSDINAATATPLAQNEHVMELFAILQENGKDTKGLSALIGCVSAMESYVAKTEQRIAEMKAQLADMKEVQNHPVKTALAKTITSVEATVAAVKVRIAELGKSIVEGCKSAVAAFKERGAAVLNGLAKFFHIKSGLYDIKQDAEYDIKRCDKAVANINKFAEGYHTAGRGLINMGLVIIGREPVDQKKENGKLTRAIAVPYKAQKRASVALRNAMDRAIVALEGLEEKQAARKVERQAERAQRPDMLAKIERNQKRVDREKRERPVPVRAKDLAATV